MCLAKITELLEPNGTEVVAWKVFHKDRLGYQRLSFQYAFFDEHTPEVPLDKWLKARHKRIEGPVSADDPVAYFSGFHVFPDEFSATVWADRSPSYYRLIIKQVKVKYIRIKGIQEYLPVWIADEMFVPSLDVTLTQTVEKESVCV